MEKLNKLGVVLLVFHAAIVFIILGQKFEGSWGGFVLFVIDFPISLLLMLLPFKWDQWVLFGIFGSLWWYILGVLITAIMRKKMR